MLLALILILLYPDGARWTTVHEVHWPQIGGSSPWAWLWGKLPHLWPWKHYRPFPQHLGENEFFCFLCYFSLLCIFAGRNVCKTWIFDSIMPLKKKLSKKQAAFLKVKFLVQSCIYNFVHIVLNYCYKEVAQIQKRNMAFCKTSLISFSSALSLFHSQTHTRIQLLWRCAAAWVWGRLQSINRTRPSSVCCHDPEPTSTNSLILASKTPFLWMTF